MRDAGATGGFRIIAVWMMYERQRRQRWVMGRLRVMARITCARPSAMQREQMGPRCAHQGKCSIVKCSMETDGAHWPWLRRTDERSGKRQQQQLNASRRQTSFVVTA